MDTEDIRRETGRSVHLLVSEERWLMAGLLGGAAGYLIWLAGTGVAVSQAAELAFGPVSVDPWSSEADLLAATFGLLWVVLPSLVAVRYVVDRITNLRGNVAKWYRFDRPILLLVPPLSLLVVAIVVGAVRGVATWYVLALLAVASVMLLVRTVAYGYRVYSLSAPRLLQAFLLVAAVVMTLATVSRASSLAGQTALVEGVAERYAVFDLVFGTVTRAGVSGPVLPLAAVVTPAALALTYIWFQLLASLVVRIRSPDVPRSAIRAGQRYPEIVRPGTSPRFSTDTASETDVDAAGTTDGPDSGDDDGRDSAGNDRSAGQPSAEAADGGTDTTVDEDPVDQFGQTRVFTPPEETEDGDSSGDGDENGASTTASTDDGSATNAVKNEVCPICGETYAAADDRSQCPNCNAVIDTG